MNPKRNNHDKASNEIPPKSGGHTRRTSLFETIQLINQHDSKLPAYDYERIKSADRNNEPSITGSSTG